MINRFECRGRIQRHYPAYLSNKHNVSEKIIEEAHLQTLHRGAGLTMLMVHEVHWIRKLRQLTKKVIRKCYGCNCFQAAAFANPPTGNLPRERTEGSIPFQVIGVDFAGPIHYKQTAKSEGKTYIILYTCSLTRALYLEVLPDMTCEEFLGSFKRMIANRGRHQKVISDNGRTFIAAAKWLHKIMCNEKLHDFLAHHKITRQFNLSRAPWWGGMFERMVGLVKTAFYKVLKGAKLKLKELQDIITDIQIILNNHLLSYCEDDIQLPTLTPSVMIFGREIYLPEDNLEDIENQDLRKREKYLRCCKDMLWRRFRSEYLNALRERHNTIHQVKELEVKPGDVVMIKGEEKNRGMWKTGVVESLITGRDGVIHAVKL